MQEIESIIKTCSLLVGTIGGLIIAFKAVIEMKNTSKQRKIEHRWKQTEQARIFLDEIKNNYKVYSALQMLDWSERNYTLENAVEMNITSEDIKIGLRTKKLQFSEKEAFIRDCFDSLYDNFEMIEHFIKKDLIVFEDIAIPIKYYVEKINKKQFHSSYMKEYGYLLTLDFIDRFKYNKA